MFGNVLLPKSIMNTAWIGEFTSNCQKNSLSLIMFKWCHVKEENIEYIEQFYKHGWSLTFKAWAEWDHIKARCHYQSFPSKTLSKKTWTKCLLSLSKVFDDLCQRIGGKSCKHEKMAPTVTIYENIAVTLCLMSIAILRRRLRDRARVRRRATRSWLLRRKQRSAYNTLLKEWHTEDPNEFRNYFRMDKTTLMMLLEKVRPLIHVETGYQTSGSHICGRTICSDIAFSGYWFSLSCLLLPCAFVL